ncbi:MAG: long-chain fatty acid--CoA ligase, partial [Acidobacteriota bacterium]|nr:long-chain fatty acid--CoA ligase [Acidobacteriota bacterium]
RIESLFKMEPLINQVLLVGDKKPYVTALLTLNFGQVQTLQGMSDVNTRPASEIIEAEPVSKAVKSVIERVNRQLADFERIRRVKIVERDFSIDSGELTPTMKIRRARVLENHAALVSELYLGKEEMN